MEKDNIVYIAGNVEVHYHNHVDMERLFSEINIIKLQNHNMAKTQAETAQEIRAIKDQNEKSRVEILDKIQKLEDALAAAGNTSDEVDAAVQDLKASVQKDDDIVPDAPPAE